MSDMLTPADLAARVAAWHRRQRAKERSRDRAVVMGYAPAYRFRQALDESGVAIAADTEWDGQRARILHYQRIGTSIHYPVGPTVANMPTRVLQGYGPEMTRTVFP